MIFSSFYFEENFYGYFFQSVISAESLTANAFMGCMLTSLLLGVAIAAVYSFKTRISRSFLLTLVVLPAIVQMVIMLSQWQCRCGSCSSRYI